VVDAQSGQVIRRIRHDLAIATSLSFDDIGALLVDHSGLQWIGTWGGGLIRHNPANGAFRTLHHSPYNDRKLSYADIGSILALADDTIWVGTHGNGIDIINPNVGVIGGIRPGELADGTVIALAETPDNMIWIGTQQAGLFRYNRRDKTLHQYTLADGLIDLHVRRILPDNQNRLWIGTYGGLSRFDMTTETFERFSTKTQPAQPFSETIYALAQQTDGTLWVGADNGLYRLPPKSAELTQVHHVPEQAGALSHNTIHGLLVDDTDTLWIGTVMGLDKLVSWHDNQPVFESFSTQVGQQGNPVWGNPLADGQGRIWFGNAMLDPNKLQFRQWDHADGVDMSPWVGSYTKTNNDLLLYGSAKGLLMIKPQSLTAWQYQPLLVVSELKVGGQSTLVPQNGLTLAPRTKSFSVEFAALDFSDSEKNRYAYRLEGYDEQWIETDFRHRTAVYTNLDPGNYTLHIRGSNRLGQWSEHQLAMPVIQIAAWYQFWWFKLTLVLIVVMLAYLLTNRVAKLRLRQLKNQKQLLKNQVHLQTQALESKNEALQVALKDLELLSLTDQLTGAHNRRFLNKFIEPELSKLRREQGNNLVTPKEDLAFIMIDIDLFKHVNDTYGHDAGDSVLVQFTAILNDICRASDWVIRWGGEEFLIVGRFSQRQQLNQLGERIRLAVLNHKFDLGAGLFINRTCSIGMSTYPFAHNIFDSLSWERTLNLADMAMYGAKNNGRNGWVSLYEDNIVDVGNFYHQTLDDLQTQIDNRTIGFDTSLDKTSFHF
jgi:diguanylate cyclase (GGDEF)-like protein